MPSYRVIANNRQPVALRDMMILPVRTGYIGADRIRKPDPALIPPSAEEAVPDVEETTVYLPVRNGYVSAQVYRPHAVDQDAALPVILYAHGGGFTVGSDFDTAYITRRLARDNSVVVVSTNYRMAPEYPFPTPLNDVADVYAWLVREAGRVGGDPSRVAVAGDSAREFASLVEKAGSPTDGYWPAGMPHGFYFFPGVHPEGDVAFERCREFLAKHLSH
ncbi:alpha/beta hydrolase [Microbacterium schleiferi]|uniref:alpha/beta hydrolase n=1 Tax=Microbacterium schleiferi TaxID=69362 RepID=UPI00311DB93E